MNTETATREEFLALATQGQQLLQHGKFSDAATVFEQIRQNWPYEAVGLQGLGIALHEQGKKREALAQFEQAVVLAPGDPGLWNNLGKAYVESGKIDEGIAAFQRSLALRPNDASVLTNLGGAFLAKLRTREARSCFERALQLAPNDPHAHWDRARLNLLEGDFERGLAEFEWRKFVFPRQLVPMPQPEWDGSDIRGKTILLRVEQGFGDMIQFVRLARLMEQRGATVVLETQPELVRLLRTVSGVSRIVLEGEAGADIDVQCSLSSLLPLLQQRLDTIPRDVPYLSPENGLVQSWGARLPLDDKNLKVGIVWSGSTHHQPVAGRSASFRVFNALASIPNVTLVSLQTAREEESTRGTISLLDFTNELEDFADTAALIAHLDLVISIDTAVAHLAGAMGKPVWTLLPFLPDWRWMVHREDSPWYPTMRLFRQTKAGDWDSVIRKVGEELRRLTNDRTTN